IIVTCFYYSLPTKKSYKNTEEYQKYVFKSRSFEPSSALLSMRDFLKGKEAGQNRLFSIHP
ncbi:hypothetical protein, partial [Streptococcus pneumoniae]|uniref:hypothetical protein n=1 Tax=Streptococcus pneumoniae TaxID=1313 RepID=UPI001E324197